MRARRGGLKLFGVVVAVCVAGGLAGLVLAPFGPDPTLDLDEPRRLAVDAQPAAKLVAVALVTIPPAEEPVAAPVENVVEPDEPEPRPTVRFLVIADLHVLQAPNPDRDPDSWLPPDLAEFTAAIPALAPAFVIVAGDLTSGDARLRHRPSTVRRWYAAVDEALEPLYAARIPILPIPGNHDLYQAEHVEGYREWADLERLMGEVADLRVVATENPDDAPLYYAVDYEHVHLTLLSVPGRHLEDAQLEWLRRDLAAAPPDAVRLAFGHVPVRSAIGGHQTNARLLRDLGPPLVEGGVGLYFAGHEHVLWDETLEVDGESLRQVIVGVGGGGYRYTLHSRHVREHCGSDECVLPTSQYRFAANDGRMRDEASGVLVEVAPEGQVSVQPHVLRGGLLVPLERVGVVRLEREF